MPALHPEIISRALLKAKGHRVPEFFGLSHDTFRELAIFGRNCENELGLRITGCGALGPDTQGGMRLELCGTRAYQVRLTPKGVTCESGPIGAQLQKVFVGDRFDHGIAGALLRTIEREEKNLWQR